MKKAWIILIAVAFAGCYNDNREELYPDTSATACDTTGMSFATDIQPILNSSCALASCHKTGSNLGGYILDTYAGVNATVVSGRFLGAIRHESGFSEMPKNASQLPSCEISRIEAWINAGAPNN